MFDLSIHMLQLVIRITIYVFLWSLLSEKKRSFLSTVCFFIIPTSAIMLLTIYTGDPYAAAGILELISCGILYFLVWKGNLRDRIRNFLWAIILSVCCAIPVMLFYRIDLDDMTEMSSKLVAAAILFQDLLFVAAVLSGIAVQRRRAVSKGQIRQLGIMLIFMLSHMLFAVVYFLDEAALQRKTDCIVQLVFQLILIVIILIQYYSSLHTQMLMQQNRTLRQMQIQQQFTFDYYTMAEQRFYEISHLRHDIRNLMQTVSLLSKHHPEQDAAEKIVADIGERLNQTKAVQFCEHSLLNTILTLKLQNPAMKSIVPDIVLQDIAALPLKEQALCSFFAAVMDSVAQVFVQCGRNDNAFSLRSRKNAHFYVVKILFPDTAAVHTMQQTLLRNDIIRSVMDAYHAIAGTSVSEDWASVTIAFPLKKPVVDP